MEPWEKALNKFLASWKRRKEVIGVLVCGSFVTGDPSEHSDIDVHILLSEPINWRERGNKVVDGFLIEYFANPPRQIKEYFKDDYNDNCRSAATQFATGKVLFDEKGEVKELKKEARKWLKKGFKAPNKKLNELIKYSLWDMLDNLQDTYEKGSKGFTYTYYNYLKELFERYAKYSGQPKDAVNRTYELLTEAKTRGKYLQSEFPDQRFVKLFVKAMSERNEAKMLSHFEKLTTHVIAQMGGFEIDGWRMRTPVEKQ